MMKSLLKHVAALAAGLMLVVASGAAWAVPVAFQLGFALDASGSITPSNYNLLRSGLNSALAILPKDGSVEISVVSFGSNVMTVVPATVLTAATLAPIQSSINGHNKDGGMTNTAGAITALTNLMTNSSNFNNTSVKSMINLATDGAPNIGYPDGQLAAIAASQAAAAAGIDALSIEAIGSGVNNGSALNDMAAMAFPKPVAILGMNSTNIPSPWNGSFVVPVSDFNAFKGVVEAKVVAAVTPQPVPEPATMLLLSAGLAGLGAVKGRRKSKTANL